MKIKAESVLILMAKYIDGNDLCQMLTDQEIEYHMDVTGEVALERKYGDVLGDVFEEVKVPDAE